MARPLSRMDFDGQEPEPQCARLVVGRPPSSMRTVREGARPVGCSMREARRGAARPSTAAPGGRCEVGPRAADSCNPRRSGLRGAKRRHSAEGGPSPKCNFGRGFPKCHFGDVAWGAILQPGASVYALLLLGLANHGPQHYTPRFKWERAKWLVAYR